MLSTDPGFSREGGPPVKARKVAGVAKHNHASEASYLQGRSNVFNHPLYQYDPSGDS